METYTQTILYHLRSNTSWLLYTGVISVSDPKPTPAQIAFSITYGDAGSDILA